MPQFVGKNILWEAKLHSAFVLKTVSIECAHNNKVQAKTNIEFFGQILLQINKNTAHTSTTHVLRV